MQRRHDSHTIATPAQKVQPGMTPERFERLKAVLAARQPDLTVLLDNVHKPHNLSAVVRSCDAVGVFEAHAVTERLRLRANHDISSGSGKWVGIRTHASLAAAIGQLRGRGMQVLAAHRSERARDFRDVDFTRPTAIVLGAEKDGVSAEAVAAADQHIEVPMGGMVESLNVSVAAALILFEAQRQRAAAGLYARCRLDPEVYERTLFEWSHPKLARFYRAQALPYPPLAEDGTVLEGEDHRRARMGRLRA